MENGERNRLAAIVLAAAVLASGMTLGLYKVGSGLASRAGNAITVTGTASENATADNAVWTLNLNESQPTLASSVKKIDSSADALKRYLLNGGVADDQIEFGPINSNAVPSTTMEIQRAAFWPIRHTAPLLCEPRMLSWSKS